ncbi:MAG TPA: tRNA pseudouridine synthase A [Thermomicrobiales bacterium]|nr:tRNA pseudouridine synthase A [Thermomicrobiales bacterium]
MEPRLKLTVAYDGSRVWGSQRQAGRETVQGILEDALANFAGRPISAELAGRTDRGVHAAGQVASCEDFRPDLSPDRVRRALEPRLGDTVSVVDIERPPPGFHARYDARWREYRYRVWAGPRSPLLERYTWHRRGALKVGAMTDAASRLTGMHDFASFVAGGEGVPWSDRQQAARGTVRTVHHCSAREVEPWWPAGEILGTGVEIRVVADGFLPRMVRGFVGALCDIGRGANEPDWIDELKDRADRRGGPRSAPPHGLVLWRIGYGDDRY